MIIDYHGHYTAGHKALEHWRNLRNRQFAGLKDPVLAPRAPERIGAVRGIDPETVIYYDDTKRCIDVTQNRSPSGRCKIYEGDARRAFPRLNHILNARCI